MIFEVDPDQVSRLDSTTLVQLMKRLLLSECRLVDVPLRAGTVPLQITIPDGGEDGRVEWTGGVNATDYFPNRFCIFQSKAQNLTEGSVKAEVLKKAETLNDALSDVLSRSGAYVIFCSKPFTGQKIKKLRKAVETAIVNAGSDPMKAAAIEIYDANKIADWVNAHPTVALWLTSRERRRSVSGFQSHKAWGRDGEIKTVPWISGDAARFDIVVADADQQDDGQDALTFEAAADAALNHLSDDPRILRIVGPSGFGKSRFAYELFNSQTDMAGEIDRVAIIYADLSIVGGEATKLALEIADADSATILVVDECPDETHLKLANIARRSGSRLRLVTIDVETKVAQADDTLIIHLERASDEMIGEIAQGIAPELSDNDARFIQELSNGFPQMAVLAARRNAGGRQTIGSAGQFLDRIIWGKRPHNDEAQKALDILSLFEWLGLSGRVSDQAAHVAAMLAGMSEDAFVEHVRSFGSRGVVVERGDFVQVQPIPLAARLAAQRLARLPEGKLASFFAQAPPNIQKSLLRRLRWLDTSNVAQEFAEQLLKENCLGNLAALNTDFGAECLDLLVHVTPDVAMTTIDRVFGHLSVDELLSVGDGRRHLLWALEKLVFRRDSFEPAATLLRRLAVAETEDHIGNNATGQFKQLFQIYLCGTEVEPSARLLVLDAGLQSENMKEVELCVDALGQMLLTNHFSRIGGSDEIGTRQRLEDWTPKIYGEVWAFHRAGMERLMDIALIDGSFADKARELLGFHIRGLISHVPFKEIRAMIDKVVAHHGFWPQAAQQVNEWLYFDRNEAPPELAAEVRSYFDDLMPTDPVDLVILYTDGWLTDFHDPDVDYDREDVASRDFEYSIRKSNELAESIGKDTDLTERCIGRLVMSDAHSAFAFARQLAGYAPDPRELFRLALAKAEASDKQANMGVFGGLIAGIDDRDPQKARECLRTALRSPKLKDNAISLIGSGRLQPDDLNLVISLLQTGDVEPQQCVTLSYGRGLDHFSAEEIVPLLDGLELHGAAGLWAALDIISMYLHGGKALSDPIVQKLKGIILSPALFDAITCETMNGHHLQEMAKLLIKNGRVDRKFARSIIKQLLTIFHLKKREIRFELKNPARSIIRELIAPYPGEVWAEISKLLLVEDALVRLRLEQLIQPDHDSYLGPGLLYALPEHVYLDWVRERSNERAAIVIRWLPVAEKDSEGSLSWHPALEAFIAEFGGEELVLGELSRRMRPKSWWGSIVPHLKPFLPFLETWCSHQKSEVRRWASEQIKVIEAEIKINRKRDEERSAGLY